MVTSAMPPAFRNTLRVNIACSSISIPAARPGSASLELGRAEDHSHHLFDRGRRMPRLEGPHHLAPPLAAAALAGEARRRRGAAAVERPARAGSAAPGGDARTRRHLVVQLGVTVGLQ